MRRSGLGEWSFRPLSWPFYVAKIKEGDLCRTTRERDSSDP